jgi:hypothetical protein
LLWRGSRASAIWPEYTARDLVDALAHGPPGAKPKHVCRLVERDAIVSIVVDRRGAVKLFDSENTKLADGVRPIVVVPILSPGAMLKTEEPTVVIGSSPLLLLVAARLAEAALVVVFEGREQLGGSWTTTSFEAYRHVETACHLLERDVAVYRVLEDVGVALVAMDPPPVTLLGPAVRLRYGGLGWSALRLAATPVSAVRAWWRIGRRAPSSQGRRLRGIVDDIARHGFRPAPIAYFEGGLDSARKTLASRVLAHGSEVIRGVEVSEVRLRRDAGPEVVLSDSRTMRAKRVISGDGLRLERLSLDGVDVALASETVSHHHLLGTTDLRRPVSYVYVPFHPALHRVTDVTPGARGGVRDRLILANLRRLAAPEEIVKALHDLGIVEGVGTGWRPLVFESTRIVDPAALHAVTAAHGLELLATHGDLIRSVRENRAVLV